MISSKHMPVEEDKFHIQAEAVNYDDRVKVLNHSDSFAIFDRWGDIHPHSKKALGIFHQGTRFISQLELKLNRKKPLLLGSSIKEENNMLSVDLANSDMVDCNVPENSLHISRKQFIRNGVYYEEDSIVNYGNTTCELTLSFSCGADFRDLFEIRGIQRTVKANKPNMNNKDGKLVFDYTGLDNIHRKSEIIFSGHEEYSIHNNSAFFQINLEPHQQ